MMSALDPALDMSLEMVVPASKPTMSPPMIIPIVSMARMLDLGIGDLGFGRVPVQTLRSPTTE